MQIALMTENLRVTRHAASALQHPGGAFVCFGSTTPRVSIAANQIATGLVPKLPSNQRLWSERATLIGLPNQETDHEIQRSDPIKHPPRSEPWNEGKLIGAKPPLRASHVWSIRTKPQLEKRTRDPALFNLAIDSKLRGCDVVAMRVDDVAPNGYTLDRATVRQKKTGRPVRFEFTEQSRQAIDEYLRLNGRKPGEFLFAGRGSNGHGLTTRQYARLVGQWVASIGLYPLKFGTQSLRRTKVTLIYRRTGNPRAVQIIVGPYGSRAQFDILASRSTMRLRSPRKSRSEYLGRAAVLCPSPKR
jgi:integrase